MTDDVFEKNRTAWNETAHYHRKSSWERLRATFSTPGAHSFREHSLKVMRQLDFAGKWIAHPNCNDGTDLISLTNLGAKGGVGFDLAEEFIAMARELAALAKVDCSFVHANSISIPSQYQGQFDIVLVTVGTFGWFPDVPAVLREWRKLLKPGGEIFIYEMHPILDMFTPESSSLEIVSSYFRTEPFVETSGIDYIGKEKYESAPLYWFPHRMCEAIKGLIDAGFTITDFQEFDHDISLTYEALNAIPHRPPLSFLLRGRC